VTAFSKSTTTYGNARNDAAPETAYDRARREWDLRIGTARVQAFHWRVMAFTSLLVMLGLSIGLVYVAAEKDVKTFVVEFDRLGRPGRITLLDDRYQPTAAQIGHFVGQTVRLVRERPLDPVVIRNNWLTAYAFLADAAINTMNEYASADESILDAPTSRLTRIVAVSNILQKSADSFQVRWVETDYVGGFPQPPTQYSGLFHVQIRPPTSEDDVFRNPLGVYIDAFSWSKEFTGPVAAAPNTVSEPSPLQKEEQDHESNP
jgi:type IV secretion system protein VirB5